MEVNVLQEAGYEQAVAGIGYSYGVLDKERLRSVAFRLSDRDGGHNKFLESMQVWMEIKAARYWWQEFDTYRVGMTKQSESTIHTICRQPVTQGDFEHPIFEDMLFYLNNLIEDFNSSVSDKETQDRTFELIKANLPEGYLQRRLVSTNYKCLRNMIWQRKHHRLKEWHSFIRALQTQLKYANILFKGWNKEKK